jgi:hypothetical protein
VLPLSRINRPFMVGPSALVSRVFWLLREAPLVLRRAGGLWIEANRVVPAKVLSWSEGPDPALVTIEENRAMEIRRQLGALQETRRDGCARALAALWDHFLQAWGGPDPFREADEMDRTRYVDRLRRASEGMEANPPQRPYALAPAAMIIYLEGLSRVSASKAEVDLAAAVVAMIDRGQEIATRRSETCDMHFQLSDPDSQIAEGATSAASAKRTRSGTILQSDDRKASAAAAHQVAHALRRDDA